MIILPRKTETRFLLRARKLYPNAKFDLSWRLGDALEGKQRSHMVLKDILWRKRYIRYNVIKRPWRVVNFLKLDPPVV